MSDLDDIRDGRSTGAARIIKADAVMSSPDQWHASNPLAGRHAIVAGCAISASVRNNCTAGNGRVNLIPMLGDPQAEELRSADLVEARRMTPHLKNLSWL